MLAVRLHAWCGVDGVQIVRIAPPVVPLRALVLVRVRAAGVTPVDWKIAEGRGRFIAGLELPRTPGCDLSGEIVEGGAGVTEFTPSDEVFGEISFARRGVFAEFSRARADAPARKSKNLSHAEAAALPVASLTAWQSMYDPGGLERARSAQSQCEGQRRGVPA